MVHFSKDVCLFSLSLVLDFLVDQGCQPFAHIVGRHEQFLEVHREVGLLYEVEYPVYFPHNGAMCCHDGEIGIHPCVSFMKISGADTGQVAKPCSDMYQLGVDFQTFHSEYHFDSCLLHAFAPADVGRFVETGEQFDDNRYFFSVLCGADQSFHYLRVFGQAIESHLDAFHFFADGCLAQYTDHGIERLIGVMQRPVLFSDQSQDTFRPVQFLFEDGRPGRIFQVGSSAVGKLHQVFEVMIAPACYTGVVFIHVEAVGQLSQQIFRHLFVIDETDRFAPFPAFDPLRYFLEHTCTQITVYLHFGVFGELESVSFIVRIIHAYEDHRQAVADNVVQKHQIGFAFRIRQADEASELGGGEPDDGIIFHFYFSLTVFAQQADGKVDVFIGLVVRMTGRFSKKERIGRPIQPVPVE